MKKNIYFVQANNSLLDSLYLPYASGTLAAFAFSDKYIKEHCLLGGFIIKKDPPSEAIKDLINPFVVGFSSYMWNIGYNLSLAELVKSVYPDCKIVFGGPQIPDNTEYLEKYDYIDYLIHGEGEVAFSDIIKAELSGRSASSIPNISYRTTNQTLHTERTCIGDISDFPSPYTMGIFDSIVNDPNYLNSHFDAVIETNRGCPYNCVYCTWGRNNRKISCFSSKRVKADLLWIAQHHIEYCFCADSNFGLFERDEEIADYIVYLKEQYGFPQKFETTTAKEKDSTVFRLYQKLESAGMNKGVSVAVQSMSPKVLKLAGRKNQPVEVISEQLKLYRQNGIMTYTDIILGLPGETYESYKEGIFSIMESGQHVCLNTFNLEVLPNTRLSEPDFRRTHKIETIKSKLCQHHGVVSDDKSFYSHSEIVVATESMTRNDWCRALKLSICVQSMHYFGLLRFIAMYLRKEKNVSFKTFYCSFFDFMMNKSLFLSRTFSTVCYSIDLFVQNKGELCFFENRLGNIYLSFEEGLFAEFAIQKERFYTEVAKFLKTTFETDSTLLNLLDYQQRIIISPHDKEDICIFNYDWQDYFNHFFDSDYCHPRTTKTAYVFDACETDSLPEYTRMYLWYGRRNNKFICNPKKIEVLNG